MDSIKLEEYDIDLIASDLYGRINEEIEKRLISQLTILGYDFPVKKSECVAGAYYFDGIENLKRFFYPDDPSALCSYEYDGIKILGVRIGPTGMSVEFDTPELKETLKNEGEVQ